jgi:5-methyltetrahydropteroyltriglutamate--homocysteine methyltransferase
VLTVTKDLVLPTTITGSWPRPRWFDMGMWGRPLDTCVMDIRYREQFGDALSTVIADEQRAGLDIVTHGDLHCDDDMAGRSWHHCPLQRWCGFEGDYLQSEETRSPWLRYPPGTLLNEIYTSWRWPRVVDTITHLYGKRLNYDRIAADVSYPEPFVRALFEGFLHDLPRELIGVSRTLWFACS